MLPALLDLLWRSDQTHLAPHFRLPPFASARRTGHPLCGEASAIKCLGHPPLTNQFFDCSSLYIG
jgi:hypothetical protein